jgi:hypothetical protein
MYHLATLGRIILLLVFAITEKCFQLGDHSAIKIDENKKKNWFIKNVVFYVGLLESFVARPFHTFRGLCYNFGNIFAEKINKKLEVFVHSRIFTQILRPILNLGFRSNQSTNFMVRVNYD